MSGLTNLYKETTEVLKEFDKTWDDVIFVSTTSDQETYEVDKKVFIERAKSIDYDSGFGGPEINLNLVIVGDDWWLERYEYDGAESWEYKEKPKKPGKKINDIKAYLRDEDIGILNDDYKNKRDLWKKDFEKFDKRVSKSIYQKKYQI